MTSHSVTPRNTTLIAPAKRMRSRGNKSKLIYGVTAILYNIRSAHNVGSIFRTADAAGISKIYLCGYTPIPLTDKEIRLHQDFGGRSKIAKTALGAEKSVAWEHYPRIGKLLKELKQKGVSVVALEQAKQSKNIFSARGGSAFGGKSIALIVGNEVCGLPPSVLKRADSIVEIPMYGKKESLNVSVAFGIAAYALIQKSESSE